MSALPRQEFRNSDLLTSADLNAAQLYQIDLGRRHRAGAHLPGVVDGLRIEKREGSGSKIVLTPGYAVDEFGRDLVLGKEEPLDTRLAQAQREEPGAITFEVRLHYDQQIERGERGTDESRIDEAPRVEVRAAPGKPDELITYRVTQAAPDDPAVRRPVLLGVLESDPDRDGEWLVLHDAAHRQETGVVASRIAPSGRKSGMTLADGEFAIVLPSDDRTEQDTTAAGATPQTVPTAAPPTAATGTAKPKPDDGKRLTVTASGAVFRGELTVEGDIAAGHQVSLPIASVMQPGSGDYGLFHIGSADTKADTHELRLALPPQGALAIGAWNEQKGKFEALLTIDAKTRSVTIAGDLFIEGAVIDPPAPPPPNRSEQDSAPAQSEEPAMLGTIGTTVLGLAQLSGRTAGGLIPLLAALWGGIYFDGSAGMLPCKPINSIREFLGIDPLLCVAPKDGGVPIKYKIAGDSGCAKMQDLKGPDGASLAGTMLTGADGNLRSVSKPDEKLSEPEKKKIEFINGLVTRYNETIKKFEAPLDDLSKIAEAGPPSIWIYCK